MADETPTITPAAPAPDAAAEAAAQAAATAATRAAESARLEAIENKIGALADTVRAAVTPRQPQGGGTPGELPGHFRQLLKQGGLTDADIDANAPVIVPFLSAMLATDGAVIASGIQQVRDEVDMVKAARNSKSFPYWTEVEDKIVELREEAAKQGQYLAPRDAYKAALALDVQSDTSRVEAAKARRKAESASSAEDVSAQNLGTHHATPRAASRRSALTGEDVAAMSREERRKFYDQIGDVPIR